MLSWKDPREWMEAMRGERWKQRITEENARANKEIQRCVKAVYGTEQAFPVIVKAFERVSQEVDAASVWVVAPFLIVVPQPGGSYMWGPSLTELHKEPIGDLAVEGKIRAVTVDIGKGAEHYEVRVFKGDKKLWSSANGSKGLAPYVAILEDRVYCLEAESPLRYTRLVSMKLLTGSDRKILYEEAERQYALSLVKGSNKGLFLFADNAGKQKVFWVNGGTVKRQVPDAEAFYVVGLHKKQPLYYYRIGSPDRPWQASSKHLPQIPKNYLTDGIEFVDCRRGILVMRTGGLRSLYKGGKHLQTFLGEVESNPWLAWSTGEHETRLVTPGTAPMPVDLLKRVPRSIEGVETRTGLARSADGSAVRWLTCCAKGRPLRGVIVTVYGAYGIPTYMSTMRWRPFLEAGIAIGFAFVRGGGDGGDAWTEAGRREGKARGVEDTEACILSIRRSLGGIPAEKTCLFGRSAGGYMVGACVARNPKGELFRIAYTEVPYVDVLKTASNPALPLTEYEYEEFGDPAHRIQDFEALLRLSPIHALGEEGAPGIDVLTRAGVNDMQVYAYESVKWIDALRGKGTGSQDNKIVFVGSGQGHFTRGAGLFVERAEDYCWILEKMLI